MRKPARFLPFFLLLGFFTLTYKVPDARADSMGLLFRGVAKIVSAVFQVPASMLKGSTQSFPLGLITGAIGGTAKTLMGAVSGSMDIARGAAPYAKYALFAI